MRLFTLACALVVAACATTPERQTAQAGRIDVQDVRGTAQQAVQNRCADSEILTEGIDVSFWQGEVDWDRVAATEVAFAIVRSSYHRHTPDEQIARNWAELDRVGLWRGAYHYLIPGTDPYQQADLYLDGLVSGGGWKTTDLPPVLDVEELRGQDAARIGSDIDAWFATVERATGERPMIYSGSYFWESTGLGNRYVDRLLWTAHYTSNPCPLIADSWSDWQFWQYTDSGSVDGVEGNVDRNVFDGDAAALASVAETGMPFGACEATDALAEAGVPVPRCSEDDASWRTTRLQWAQELAASAGVALAPSCPNPFVDVDDPAVRSLAALDYGDARTVFDASASAFRPQDPLTRCEAVVSLVEAWNLAPAAATLEFADTDAIPGWCRGALETAVNAAIVPRATYQFRGAEPLWHFELHAWLTEARARYGVPSPPAGAFVAECALDCADACEVGDVACFGTQVRRCADVDADACLEWAEPEACGAGLVCEGGACVEASGALAGLCVACADEDACAEGQRCVSASFDPELRRCAAMCESAGDCPSDFTCGIEGLCVPQFVEACRADDVWSFDACGAPVGVLTACLESERCEDGACVPRGDVPEPIEGSGDPGPAPEELPDAGTDASSDAGTDAGGDPDGARADTPGAPRVDAGSASDAGSVDAESGSGGGCAAAGGGSAPALTSLLLAMAVSRRRLLLAGFAPRS